MTTRAKGFIPFPEEAHYREMAVEGKKRNLFLFVFFPDRINPFHQKIKGYTFASGRWKERLFPYPSYVYDRAFYTAESLKRDGWRVSHLRRAKGTRFLNRGLPDKWEQYLTLKKNPSLKDRLPPQERYKNGESLKRWIEKEGELILKPVAGGFGKGVLHLTGGTPTLLEGRTRKNHLFRRSFPSTDEAIAYLLPRLTSRYLIQSYLPLTTKEGNPFDIRLFMQKDEEGAWRKIGQGVRLGLPHHLTSNLHGGGRTMSLAAFRSEHPLRLPVDIEEELDRIGYAAAATLERAYPPLFEVGIDIGIDQGHHLWILEANGKPGREIFAQMGDGQGYRTAQLGPIRYALYLEKKGELGHGISHDENHTLIGEGR